MKQKLLHKLNRVWAALLAFLLVAVLLPAGFAASPAVVTLSVTKTVTGDVPQTPETFVFVLESKDGAPLPASAAGGTAQASVTGAGTVQFDSISFTEPGEYQYSIYEKPGTDSHYTYDATVYSLAVQVTQSGAALSAELTLKKPGTEAKQSEIAFSNSYSESNSGGDSGGSAKGSLTVSKTVAGASGDLSERFSFRVDLTTSAGAALTGSYSYSGSGVSGGTIASGDTVQLAHGQSITIKNLPRGTKYTVTELEADKNGYKTTVTGASGSIAASQTAKAAFTNTRDHKLTPVIVDPPVGTKVLSGDTPGTTAIFRFKMAADDPAYPMPAGAENGVLLVPHAGAGEIEFGNIAFTDVGVYTYTISEVADGVAGYTYDSTIYTMTVTVTDPGDGLLEAVRVIRRAENTVSRVTFVNNYQKPNKPGGNGSNTGGGTNGGTGTNGGGTNGGSGSSGGKLDNQPKTSDDTSLPLWAGLCGASLLGMGLIALWGRRAKKTHAA